MIKDTVKNNTKNQGKKYKIVMIMTDTNNKIWELRLYDKVINNSIYGYYQKEVIKKKL